MAVRARCIPCPRWPARSPCSAALCDILARSPARPMPCLRGRVGRPLAVSCALCPRRTATRHASTLPHALAVHVHRVAREAPRQATSKCCASAWRCSGKFGSTPAPPWMASLVVNMVPLSSASTKKKKKAWRRSSTESRSSMLSTFSKSSSRLLPHPRESRVRCHVHGTQVGCVRQLSCSAAASPHGRCSLLEKPMCCRARTGS